MHGEKPVKVEYPDEDILVFDVEVSVKTGENPTLAVAVSPNAWYGWVSSALVKNNNPVGSNHYTSDMFIPLEGKLDPDRPRIVIGHNVSYDRARVKEQYYIKNSALRFLDTMAIHISIAGVTSSQKAMLKSKTADPEKNQDWMEWAALSSLHDLYQFYCDAFLKKFKRDVFVSGSLQDVRDDFQELMTYCANDVSATFSILHKMFPTFLERFPHPVTLAGMLEMGTSYLPVNENWERFINESEETYEDCTFEIDFLLRKKADKACKLMHDEKYKNDLWMWSEDWSTRDLALTKKKLKKEESKEEKINEEEDEDYKNLCEKFEYLFRLNEILPKNVSHLCGYPAWYKKLCEKPEGDWVPGPVLISPAMKITPKLLNLKWEHYPLHHIRELGWGIIVPDLRAEGLETIVPFEELKRLAYENGFVELFNKTQMEMEKEGGMSPKQVKKILTTMYKGSAVWTDYIIDNCCFFLKLPHANGPTCNVGNPLSRDFLKTLSANVLTGPDASAKKVLEMTTTLSYWKNNQARILNQMVVWLNKKEISTMFAEGHKENIGVILPKIVVSGTLTRRATESTWLTASKHIQNRIGSELKAMVQAPPNYHIIGADVDSEELWIASLIGDAAFAKIHGGTAFGWMTISGSKENETDMHTLTAKACGISRDEAKVINYARIYGAGSFFAERLLLQCNPTFTDGEARYKARRMYALTKGKRLYKLKESAKRKLKDLLSPDVEVTDIYTATTLARQCKMDLGDMFESAEWVGGMESAMFNRLEDIANSTCAQTPFLQCRLSKVLEARFEGDNMYGNTRVNWVVQSGAVDFLHLLLVCMKWLTKGEVRYCISFHDEVRYLVPSEKRYSAALALQIAHLLTRAFCSHRLGIYDVPRSVAFFSSVEVDKVLRKEASDDCITPSNPHGLQKGYGIPPGESLDIYATIEKSGGSLEDFQEKVLEIEWAEKAALIFINPVEDLIK